MIQTPEPEFLKLLETKLGAYPSGLRERVLLFHRNRAPESTDAIVTDILRYHAQDRFDSAVPEKGDCLLLVEHLGIDSLTMTEIAFEAEEFLRISITNEDILKIRSLRDLKDFVRQRTAS